MSYGDFLVRPGLGNTNSYLISGTPFITGGALDGTVGALNGEVCIVFPSVCRSFTVVNLSDAKPIVVSFDSRANSDVISQHHYVTIANQYDSWTYAVKATGIYISMANAVAGGSFELSAELTCIEAKELRHPLSGSGINSQQQLV